MWRALALFNPYMPGYTQVGRAMLYYSILQEMRGDVLILTLYSSSSITL